LISSLRACQRQWDADVRYYTSAHAADDLEQLRQRYGFEQINLIGGSYGTRMAQVYLRRYPERVRSVIIDGVVPTRLHLGSEHGMKLDQTLEQLFVACARIRRATRRFLI
jgi:pimeloyl-ACP methyl ester carboxylesterase